MNETNPTGIIRITKAEAESSHVDDLLKRQMSMRGEPGVTRDRRRKWYYQNWLVFALVGALGAFAAWAMIEPFFDDELYVQGAITHLNPDDALPERVVEGDQALVLRRGTQGSLRINGERIYLLEGLREILPGGGTAILDPAELREGRTVGLYVEFHPGVAADVALAAFVVLHPKPMSPERAQMKLGQLQARTNSAALMLFPLVAGMIGLFLGAIDGVVCRLPRRALLSGAVGLLVGLVGGFLSYIFANLAYTPLHQLAVGQMQGGGPLGAFGFAVQMVGRSLAWGVAGLAMGLGQGFALRSQRLLIYGLIGGVMGGLFGGLLFDPIDLILLGPDKPSAHLSRLIGLVELLARDAWLRMTQGPLTGKEFLLFKDVMSIGASPRSDVYLFNDPQVAKLHASIRTVGDECEIEARESTAPVLLNNRAVQRARLRHGDNITIGRTSFIFQRRKG